MKRLVLLFLLVASPAMAQRIVLITGGTVTANVTDSADFYVTLNQNVTGVTLTSTVTPATGYLVSMKFVQDATGSRTVAFGGNISTACVVNSTANSVTICRWQYTASTNAWTDSGAGGVTTTSSIPGEPGVTAVPVTLGLMSEYRFIEGTGTTVKDYSGNGRDCTFAAGGNAPAWTAGTSGGVAFNGAAVEWVSCPASLNSALTIMVYISSYNESSAIAEQSIVQGNGNGSSGNAIGLMLTRDCTGTNSSVLACPFATQEITSYGNNAYRSQSKMTFNGTGVIALTLDTTDHLYLNGKEAVQYFSTGTSAGLQTVGNYQIGGANVNNGSSVGTFTAFVGNIYYVAFWSRVLTAAEVAASSDYMQRAMIARGVTPLLGGGLTTPTGGNSPNRANEFVFDGDSIAAGPFPNLILNGPGTWNITDTGLGGETLASMIPNASQVADPLFSPLAERNVAAIWGGTNDNCTTAANCALQVGLLRAYCDARHKVGWKCLVLSMLSRTGEDASKNLYNTEMRQQWPGFADGLVDMAADPNVGADGASANTTFFTDGVHLTTNGKNNDVTPIMARAVNRLYGNTNFSTATVYVAPALAATATTAGSETGNTITLTFGATPANCLSGNTITVAGTTPAGYSGTWTILPGRTATTVTYWTNTTGLGPITVQGTGVCPQQQDADQYAVLNFGAGNFTLETCQGYTGQNIFIQNINGTASTLVPFGSETITGGGGAPTTLAANTTAILQSQLVSASAAGCNWRRLQ